MKQHEVIVPQIGLIAGTRAMLGAGIALLLSGKLSGEQRRAIGWTWSPSERLRRFHSCCNCSVKTIDRTAAFLCMPMDSWGVCGA
jgi:hypothetical protein